jgi:DNA polymerase III epsilon subunit-like protein
MINKFPYVSIDIETTGLDSQNCDIIEFGAVLDDLSDQRPIHTLPVFHCYFVKEEYRGEPFALSMHPTIFRRIAERGEEENRNKYHYFSAEKFGNSFKSFLVKNGYQTEHDKVTINAAGKNFGSFDLQFLKHKTDLLKHVNIRSRIVDPGILFLDGDDDAIPGLNKCKERAKITGTVTHCAVDDAIDVVKVLRYGLKHIYNPTIRQ